MSAYRYVEVAGRRLAALPGRAAEAGASARADAGAAAPILLVHGAGGAARNFFTLLRHLPPTACAIDLPGHGKSPGPALERIDDAAALVLAAAGAFGLSAAPTGSVLAGHSLGAAIALRAAAAAPAGEVAGYAAIGAGARLTLGTELAQLAEESFEHFLERLRQRGTADATLQQLRETGAEAVARDLAMAAGHGLLDDARRLAVPALVLAGAADQVATPSNCFELWQALSQASAKARLVIEPGASHLVMVDRPREVASALLALAGRAG